jgi:hypothetical protein
LNEIIEENLKKTEENDLIILELEEKLGKRET